jgi:hypothetical protein
MSTTKTQTGKSHLTATVITPHSISLNGDEPDTDNPLGTMGYRIGTTDRVVGSDASDVPVGFTILNQTNGNVFQNVGGKWYSLGTNFDQVDPTLYPAWNNTTPGVGGPGVGYNTSTSDRSGSAEGYPNGFLIWNQATGNAFVVSGGSLVGGSWTGGTWGAGTFPDALKTAWREQEGNTYVESTIIHLYGKSRIVH